MCKSKYFKTHFFIRQSIDLYLGTHSSSIEEAEMPPPLFSPNEEFSKHQFNPDLGLSANKNERNSLSSKFEKTKVDGLVVYSNL